MLELIEAVNIATLTVLILRATWAYLRDRLEYECDARADAVPPSTLAMHAYVGRCSATRPVETGPHLSTIRASAFCVPHRS